MAKEREYYAHPSGKPRGYVTVAAAAKKAHCHKVTIRRLISKGRVVVVRWRDRVLIRESDLDQWNSVRKYRRRPKRQQYAEPEASAAPAVEARESVEATA
jgi:excisionase family DNA binding protein